MHAAVPSSFIPIDSQAGYDDLASAAAAASSVPPASHLFRTGDSNRCRSVYEQVLRVELRANVLDAQKKNKHVSIGRCRMLAINHGVALPPYEALSQVGFVEAGVPREQWSVPTDCKRFEKSVAAEGQCRGFCKTCSVPLPAARIQQRIEQRQVMVAHVIPMPAALPPVMSHEHGFKKGDSNRCRSVYEQVLRAKLPAKVLDSQKKNKHVSIGRCRMLAINHGVALPPYEALSRVSFVESGVPQDEWSVPTDCKRLERRTLTPTLTTDPSPSPDLSPSPDPNPNPDPKPDQVREERGGGGTVPRPVQDLLRHLATRQRRRGARPAPAHCA